MLRSRLHFGNTAHARDKCIHSKAGEAVIEGCAYPSSYSNHLCVRSSTTTGYTKARALTETLTLNRYAGDRIWLSHVSFSSECTVEWRKLARNSTVALLQSRRVIGSHTLRNGSSSSAFSSADHFLRELTPWQVKAKRPSLRSASTQSEEKTSCLLSKHSLLGMLHSTTRASTPECTMLQSRRLDPAE